jgi:hypothetical protein
MHQQDGGKPAGGFGTAEVAKNPYRIPLVEGALKINFFHFYPLAGISFAGEGIERNRGVLPQEIEKGRGLAFGDGKGQTQKKQSH